MYLSSDLSQAKLRILNTAGFLLWGLKPSTTNVFFYCWVFTGFLSGVTGFYILDHKFSDGVVGSGNPLDLWDA